MYDFSNIHDFSIYNNCYRLPSYRLRTILTEAIRNEWLILSANVTADLLGY